MQRKKGLISKITVYFLPYVLSLWILSCANMGMPEGGAKDVDPPKIKLSTPANYSRNFNSKRVKITFDEYIVLKNINQALVVSPPLDVKPEVKIKGKSLIIDFPGTFLENTTYSVNFGNAIADNNEGNILANFSYVFSTGDILDSLSIRGKIINSFTDKPQPNTIVMAYTEYEDSVPITHKPLYIARSLEDGSFALNNLKDTTYKIFALTDVNNNYLFDQPNEEIAFSDTLIKPFVRINEYTDTLRNDSLGTDSIIFKKENLYFPNNIELGFFREDNFKQYLKSASRPEKEMIKISFNIEIKDSIRFVPENFSESNLLFGRSESNDSIFIWLLDSMEYNSDTLYAEVFYNTIDSVMNPVVESKKISLGYKPKSLINEKLNIGLYPKDKSKLDIDRKVTLKFDNPILKTDTSQITLISKADTNKVEMNYRLYVDSVDIRKYYIDFETEWGLYYILCIEDSAFCDITGLYNDSTGSVFGTRKLEEYGNIIVGIKDFTSDGIAQLFDGQDKLVEEKFFNGSSKVSFNTIRPGSYKLKFINDQNNNKKWDTGNYIKKIQPEKTYMYNEVIKVRSNWDQEIEWSPSPK